MKILGLGGWSGAGKTTLIENLLPELRARGLRVSTAKHAHHDFDLDRPGKDSYRHRQAGAEEVLIASAGRWALMRELRGKAEPSLADLLRHLTPVDLLLVEGFKSEPHAKLEIHRRDLGKPLLSKGDPSYLAILADRPLPEAELPVIPLDDLPAIVDFILAYCGKCDGKAA